MSLPVPLSLCLPATRRGRMLALMMMSAWTLSACSLVRPPTSSVPKPPLLVALPESSELAPTSDQSPAALQAAQGTTLQALLTRSDASVRLIDAGRFGELWGLAAPFLQATGQGERILSGIASARAALGPVQGRGRAGTQGVQTLRAGAQSQMPPPGQYANVEYTARLASGGTAIERLSFRQESDGWRFTGYTAQVVPPAPAATQ